MISDAEAFALRHPRIVEFHKFFSEYHLWFEAGHENFRVTIRIYETGDGRFFFVQSHFLHTPLHDKLPVNNDAKHDTAHIALTNAVGSITTYYDRAVESGHEPGLDWFKPNDLF